MKILITSELFFPANLGGPANTYYWIAKALTKKGINVTVVASSNYILDHSIIFNKWLYLENIHIRYCSASSKLPLRIIWHSLKMIGKVDTVLLCSICYLPNFFLAIAAIIRQKKIIWSIRGELFDSALGSKRNLKVIYFKILKLLFSKYVLFHTTSEAEKNLVTLYFGSSIKVVTIPNFMELPKKVPRLNNKKYILFSGRINPIKAIDRLLLGLKNSNKFLNSQFFLYLAGLDQNRYQDKLKKIIDKDIRLKEKVIFLGNKDKATLNSLYANAYFTVLLSHSENFGNVVIESLSQETPVIASHGTPWKILEDYNAGLWIDNDPIVISQAIDSILELSKKDYLKIRENAGLLSKKFDISKNIDSWIAIL